MPKIEEIKSKLLEEAEQRAQRAAATALRLKELGIKPRPAVVISNGQSGNLVGKL